MADRTPSVSRRLLSAMVKGSFAFAHVAWLVAVGIGFWWAQGLGAANAAVGGALVLFFFGAGQGVQLLAGEMDPRTGVGLAMLSYLARVAVLGGLLWLAMNDARLDALFLRGPFFVSVMVVLLGWLAGMFWVHSRLRIPIYDSQWDEGPTGGRSV
ncbi:hypothetical protein [Aestuariimicrobium ganziense]|uniref:hypothetical protein n=1 Tax=Aestuariimicrobium ganziense TaxID=2773677 RepID=UPI001940A9A0|nr:hypothetical protein [Aestuariimicrobium ganziense]